MKITLIGFFILTMYQQLSFKETQRKQSRVKVAYAEKESIVKKYFSDKKLSMNKFQLFIRAFKKEQILEIWIKENNKLEFILLHTYNFCTTSGVLGPKRKEGDLQIPEGIYYINHFNPVSNFYLSLGINYPNESDKILSDPKNPGGAIYIHGNCVTIGCIPITDDKIKELYVLAVEAKNGGQDKIPVHVFPTKLDANGIDFLRKETAGLKTIRFWENLQSVYQDFESSKKLKTIGIDKQGRYTLQ